MLDIEIDPHSAQLTLGVALVSVITYIILFQIWRKVSQRRFKSYGNFSEIDKRDWGGRGPSTLHAVVVSAATAYIFLAMRTFDEGLDNKSDHFLERTSSASTAVLAFSTGYFLTDLVIIIRYYPTYGDAMIAIHHVAALASLISVALTGQAHAYTLLLLATEATTPIVNLRWALDKAGMRAHPVYVVNGMAMAVSWAIVRVAFMAFYVFPMMWRNRAEHHLLNWVCYIEFLTVPPLLFTMNLFWFYKIAKGALALVDGSSNKGKNKKRT